MDLSIISTAVVRVCGALPRFASTCFKCFKSLHAHNAAKRNHGLIALTIAEQLERYAQSCASLGEDNAVALHSDDPYPHVICALPKLRAPKLTGNVRADHALVPRYRDLMRHVVDVNQHVDDTAAQNSTEDSLRTLESRADETAVRAWQLADAYRKRCGLPAPQLGAREVQIRNGAFARNAA